VEIGLWITESLWISARFTGAMRRGYGHDRAWTHPSAAACRGAGDGRSGDAQATADAEVPLGVEEAEPDDEPEDDPDESELDPDEASDLLSDLAGSLAVEEPLRESVR
jgi:hypothetical protein